MLHKKTRKPRKKTKYHWPHKRNKGSEPFDSELTNLNLPTAAAVETAPGQKTPGLKQRQSRQVSFPAVSYR